MSFSWSSKSQRQLATVDPKLKAVFDRALELGVIDITIIEGHRNEAAQEEMVRTGKSQLAYPNSKHNSFPSQAVDAIPVPFPGWNNIAGLAMFSGFIIGVAASLDVPIRAGIDWNGNFDPTDNWIDAPHFELAA